MVSAQDLKVYHSTSKLGGAITGTQIQNGAPNNLFINVARTEQIAGTDEYKCCFFKNTHGTESMDNFKLWLSSGSRSSDTTIAWNYDAVALRSIKFDGVNDLIDCTNDSALWSKDLTKFTFSVWIWPTAGWDGNTRWVINHGGGSVHGKVIMIDPAVSGKVTFELRKADTTLVSASGTGLTLNKWNNVVCTYDSTLGSQNVKIRINNVLGATTANLTETLNVSASLQLGSSTTDFKGFMQDFQFWDDRALSTTDIQNLWDRDFDSLPDPAYWLTMRDFADAATPDPNPVDKMSNTKVGTLTNGAAYNYDAQVISETHIEPLGMEWIGEQSEPSAVKFKKLYPGMYFPIWLRYHVSAGAESMLQDSELFSFKMDIPQGGTGSSGGGSSSGGDGTGGGGGGTGGNPPPANTDYKIAFAGDWGCENETDDVIDLIKSRDYDFLVGVGDNAYASSSCWIDRFKPLRDSGLFRISAYGNHEYSESGGTGPYKSFFSDTKTYYTWKFQNIFFMVIDSNIDMDSGGTQHTAIKNALLASLDDNTITWRVGIIHHPWFGASSDHSYNDGNSVQAFHRLFQDNKVQFVVSGHVHNWQRTDQVVYNSGNPESPTVVDSSSPYSATKKGIIHVVTGTGGHDSGSSLYSLGGQPGFQAYQNRSHNGIWEMVASNNGQTLTCKFVDTDGHTYDSFTITAS